MVQPVNGITLICAWELCSKSFVAFPSAVKNGKKYCSTACANLGAAITRRRRETRTCAYEPCGRAFEVVPSTQQLYCSHPCAELASRYRRVEYTTVICAYKPCSTPFEVPPSRLKEATFCGRACQTKAIAGLRWPQSLAERFWSKVAQGTKDECWLWQASVHHSGYGQFQVRENGKLLHDGAYVASFFLHHGRWPAPDMQVLHTCDVKACCNPAHLWEGTQTANMVDCVEKGRNGNVTHPELLARGERHGRFTRPERTARGERHGLSKLTDAQSEEMRQLYATGQWSQHRLAQRYNVHQTSISKRLRHHKQS
jgi:hypothetical protein